MRGEFWRGTTAPITSSSTVNDGNWHHVALTANVNTQSLYLDGVLVGTASGTIDPLDMTKNQIGIGYTAGAWPAANGGWYGFDGLLDEVRVYNRALSLAEIQAIYAGMGTGVPVANNDTYGTNQNTALNESAPGVLGNDTDAAGDPLTAVLVSGPAHGSLTLNADGSFTYTPNTGYVGSDSFSYKANDGTYDSNVATVSITVV